MKRVRVNAGKVAMVYKYGDLNRVLTEGVYWIGFNETEVLFNMDTPIDCSQAHLTLLIRNRQFEKLVTVVEVKDDEIVIQYNDGKFTAVLKTGKYAFWKGLINYSFTRIDLSKKEITENISKTLLARREIFEYVRVYVVESYERAVMEVDGRVERMLEAGTYFFWKTAEQIRLNKVDLRVQQMEVSGQEILTKDKAAIRVNYFSQYKVTDVLKALTNNKEFEKQLYVITQLAIRESVGTLTLDELMARKEELANEIGETVRASAEILGVEVLSGGIKDIILPGEVKEIMNQVLIAEKKAQANTIMRREETASTRSLLNTAKLMEENTMLFKLKEMEYVEKIADKINTISLSGGGQMIDQLRQIFSTG